MDNFTFSMQRGQAEIDIGCLLVQPELFVGLCALNRVGVIATQPWMNQAAHAPPYIRIYIEVLGLTCVGKHDIAASEQLLLETPSGECAQARHTLPPATAIGCNSAYTQPFCQPDLPIESLSLPAIQLQRARLVPMDDPDALLFIGPVLPEPGQRQPVYAGQIAHPLLLEASR